jgi:hypothetical protein
MAIASRYSCDDLPVATGDASATENGSPIGDLEQDFVRDIDKNRRVGDADRLTVARAALPSDWAPSPVPERTAERTITGVSSGSGAELTDSL